MRLETIIKHMFIHETSYASDYTQYHKISIALLVTRSPSINRIRNQQRMTLDANPGSLCFNYVQVSQQEAINFNNKSAGEKQL